MTTQNENLQDEVKQEEIQPEVVNEEVQTEEQNAPQEDPLVLAQARIAELEVYIAEVDKREQDIQLRAQAEIQNIRRRAEQDVEKAHKFALEKFF